MKEALLSGKHASPVKQFLNSTIVNDAVGKVRKFKSQKQRAAPLAMSNIDAARIKVYRGELPEIIEDAGDQLEGVYENSIIKTPRVTRSDGSAELLGGGYERTTWGLERPKALGAWSAFGV